MQSKRPGTRSEMPEGVMSEADRSQSQAKGLRLEPMASALSGDRAGTEASKFISPPERYMPDSSFNVTLYDSDSTLCTA